MIEGTTTRTISGEYKVSAKMSGGFGLGPVRFRGETGTEGGETTSTSQQEWQLELDPEDVSEIIAALEAAKAPHFIVLGDFHYLPEETQKDFAVALKAFHEASKYCFIVVGVWRDKNRLIQHNGDLTGRVIAIDTDKWSNKDLQAVVTQGERLLNITFDTVFVDALIANCLESVYVVQECCRRACEAEGIYQTQDVHRTVAQEKDTDALIKAVVDQHSARYLGFIVNFAIGFITTQLEMYRWLLYPVLTASVEDLEKGLLYGTLRKTLDEHHPKGPINAGNLTQALQSTASLQVGKMAIKPIILDYDQTNRVLNVVDRSFLIWLQHQDRNGLLAYAGLGP